MEGAMERRVDQTLAGNRDTSFLKVLALCLMLVDHLGATLFRGVPELRLLGRMAFPLYAWCLVVGSVKTRDPFRYGMRLLGLGLVAQPLYMMALNHGWANLNILFSLVLGLCAIYGIQRKWCYSQFWGPALCYALLTVLQMDYGWRGLTFILVLYGARKTKSGLIAAYMAYALFWGASSSAVTTLFGLPLPFLQWAGGSGILSALFRIQGMVWLSLPLIALQTNTGLRMPQWLGYALYPMHLVLLIVLRLAFGGATWPMLLAGF